MTATLEELIVLTAVEESEAILGSGVDLAAVAEVFAGHGSERRDFVDCARSTDRKGLAEIRELDSGVLYIRLTDAGARCLRDARRVGDVAI